MSRRLRHGERELWDRVAKTTQPLIKGSSTPPEELISIGTSESRPQQTEASGFRLAPFALGSKSQTAQRAPVLNKPPAPRMDAKIYKRLVSGNVAPESTLDLHGLTLAQAQPELVRFVLDSHRRHRRLLLVITGKGDAGRDMAPIPYQRGILRRQVPHWLKQQPLAPLILDALPAAKRHGGDGALYIYLRRMR